MPRMAKRIRTTYRSGAARARAHPRDAHKTSTPWWGCAAAAGERDQRSPQLIVLARVPTARANESPPPPPRQRQQRPVRTAVARYFGLRRTATLCTRHRRRRRRRQQQLLAVYTATPPPPYYYYLANAAGAKRLRCALVGVAPSRNRSVFYFFLPFNPTVVVFIVFFEFSQLKNVFKPSRQSRADIFD